MAKFGFANTKMTVIKSLYLGLVFTLGTIAIVFILLTSDNSKILASDSKGNESQTPEISEVPSSANQSSDILVSILEETVYKYVLKTHEGRLALFEFNQTRTAVNQDPLEIYEVYVRSLPEYDAEMLLKGIPIQNDTVLQETLLDYTS